MQTEAGLLFNISRGECAGEGRGIVVDHMGSAIRVSMVFASGHSGHTMHCVPQFLICSGSANHIIKFTFAHNTCQ